MFIDFGRFSYGSSQFLEVGGEREEREREEIIEKWEFGGGNM